MHTEKQGRHQVLSPGLNTGEGNIVTQGKTWVSGRMQMWLSVLKATCSTAQELGHLPWSCRTRTK